MENTTYLFDFDGTLVNSMSYWADMMTKLLDSHKVSYPHDIIKIITPLGVDATAKYFIDVLKIDMTFDEVIKYMYDWALPVYTDVIKVKSGVVEYLTMLKNKGCSLNVLTASPHETLDPCLKNNGIYDLFDNIWSCSDFGLTKSDVQLFHNVAHKLGKKENEITFFDDNIVAVKTALQAGFNAVGVYDKSGEEFRDELKAVAQMYIDSFECLLR